MNRSTSLYQLALESNAVGPGERAEAVISPAQTILPRVIVFGSSPGVDVYQWGDVELEVGPERAKVTEAGGTLVRVGRVGRLQIGLVQVVARAGERLALTAVNRAPRLASRAFVAAILGVVEIEAPAPATLIEAAGAGGIADGLRTIAAEVLLKGCACCAARIGKDGLPRGPRPITREEWAALKSIGYQDDGALVLELRNCVCGSTLSIPVAESEAARR